MKQKIVIKVQMNCNKCRSKALKIAAVASGVSSVALEGEEKDQVVVIGDEVDSAALTKLLRKKVGYASIISVQEEKKKEEKKDKDEVPIPWASGFYQYPQIQMYETANDPIPRNCSIM